MKVRAHLCSLGIGHGEDHGHTAGEGGLGRGIPIILMGGAGFAHMDMKVDESGGV